MSEAGMRFESVVVGQEVDRMRTGMLDVIAKDDGDR